MRNPMIKCLMCFGIDAETQERLKDREPDMHCLMCQGLGSVEVTFQEGLEPRVVRTRGINQKTGYPIILVDKHYESQFCEQE
jgi:hypothetical protein